MSNGHVAFLQGVYRAMFKDIARLYPHLRQDLERDLSRLLSNVERRGLHHLMIDLVDFGKHFDRCLAASLLVPSGLPCFKAISKDMPIPSFMKGMTLRVFNASGVLRTDCDVQAIRIIREVLYLAKKFKMECTNERKRRVLRAFFTIDQELPHSPAWDYDSVEWDSRTNIFSRFGGTGLSAGLRDLFDLEGAGSQMNEEWMCLLQDTFDLISSSLGVFDPSVWHAKHGPGAVSDLGKGLSKYEFPTWPDKLSNVFPLDEFGFANLNTWSTFAQSQDSSRFARSEMPSRLILVPKTLKAPRLIASEPTSHQWCQQLIRCYLESRVKETFLSKFVHFGDQRYNQKAALQGSLDQKLATIDLSEASDRVSTPLVECAFRRLPSLLDALHAARTRWCINTIDASLPKFHKLRKFACMGSACTFPIQSILFAGIAIASVLYVRKQKATFANVEALQDKVLVFGDDIVVPTDCVGVLQASLRKLFLKVNVDKTFKTGKFRESCGVDAYAGVDVTPTYVLKRPEASRPDSVISAVATVNNLRYAGYNGTADYIRSTVPRRFRISEVVAGSGRFGYENFGPVLNSEFAFRYNTDLQRSEIFCHVPKSTLNRRHNRADDALLQYFTENPSPLTKWANGFGVRRPRVSLDARWVPA